jgi:membrane-associated protease RseP (regulator of RpoE activity)
MLPTIAAPLLAAMLASWVALLFHELAHSAAAEVVGVRIWGMRLGMGPTIWKGSVNGREIQIGAFPFLGTVQLLDEDAGAIGYRDIVSGRWRFEWGPEAWRAPIISIAGGLSNLFGMILFLVTWELGGQPKMGSFMGDLLIFGIVTNLSGYLNLFPWSKSDGGHLLAHLYAARLLRPVRATS